MLQPAVTFVENAATAANFVRYCVVPVQVLDPAAQDMTERERPVAVLIDYNPNGIAATLTNPLQAFLRTINDPQSPVIAIVGTIVDQDCYYVLVQERDAQPPRGTSRRAASNEVPATLSPHTNHTNGKVRMKLKDIIATMPTIDAWFASQVAQQQLIHDDEELESYEYCTVDPDHPEMYLYTHSPSHNKNGRYLLSFDDNKRPAILTNVSDTDCRACMQEHNELVTLGRGGW